MIISITWLSAIAAATLGLAFLTGAVALVLAAHARRGAREARSASAIAALRIDAMEVELARQAGRMDELLAERERSSARPARPSLREAVALSRHGASTEELVNTCRIGHSEARLIQMLYGAGRAPGAMDASGNPH
jgi:hypothetical protein